MLLLLHKAFVKKQKKNLQANIVYYHKYKMLSDDKIDVSEKFDINKTNKLRKSVYYL